MYPNIWALILSFILVFVVIGLSTLLQKLNILGDEGARKFIHIGVSNWWFLVIYMFDSIWFAIIPPIIFIILNYASYKMNLIKSMERSGRGNLGTVYFPIALLFFVIAAFTFSNAYVGAVSILTLGYGDGFAAVIGKKYGKKRLENGKSLVGTITMFIVTYLVAMTLSIIYLNTSIPLILIGSLIVALVATLTELFTPKGLDNLSIPLVVGLVVYGLLRII